MDQMIVRPKGVPANSALAKSEHELYEAMTGAFEAFFAQGVILNRINIEKEYKEAGFESFADYMNERQPCGLKKTHAYALIAAMKLRPLLPDISGNAGNAWTQRSVEPLLHKDFSPADQKRLGKKIATRVKNGDKLTAALVKEICDEDRGVERRAAAKKRQEVAETPTPAGIVTQCRMEIRKWVQALGSVPGAFWEDAKAEDSGCCEDTSEAISELASIFEAGNKPARKDVHHARRH